MDIIIKIKQTYIEIIKRYTNVHSVIYDKSNKCLKISCVSKNSNCYDTETYNYTSDYEIIKISEVEE